jgi:hypothetical protein
MQIAAGTLTEIPIDIAWQEIFDENGDTLGTLWEFLPPGQMFSIIVRFTQADTPETTNNNNDGWIQPGAISLDSQSAAVIFIKDVTPENQQFSSVVTSIGAAKIAARIAGGEKLIITQAAIDDGNGQSYTPSPAQTALVNEVWRGDIAAGEVDGNVIRTLIVLAASLGPFWCRAVGLFDEDGDLIAVANIPTSQKVPSYSGADFKKRIMVNTIVADGSVIKINVNPVLNTVDHEQMREALAALEAELRESLRGHDIQEHAHAEAFAEHDGRPGAHSAAIAAHNSAAGAHGNHFTNRSNPHGVNFEQIVPGGILPVALGGTGFSRVDIAAFGNTTSIHGWGMRCGPFLIYWGLAWNLNSNNDRAIDLPHAFAANSYIVTAQIANEDRGVFIRNKSTNGFALRLRQTGVGSSSTPAHNPNQSIERQIHAQWLAIGLAG